jgi:hypothetical protein
VVPLKPFSFDPVKDVFMQIEEPEHPLELPSDLVADLRLTIGEFYAAIRKQLASAVFASHPRRQLTPEIMGGLIEVVDTESAMAAIDLIVEQGEGTSKSPLDGPSDELAHYYRFAEIREGHELIPNPHAGPHTPPDEAMEGMCASAGCGCL